ncbi:MAG: hypothetical protein QHH06_15705 [Clostridiales bacterium]|nr:hypothetical protein [Eubacteriales bacterium]MDH7567879.1 hypothetical protein [Clostridiales bacterium]
MEAPADLDEDAVLEEVEALKSKNVPVPDVIASLQEGMASWERGPGEKSIS